MEYAKGKSAIQAAKDAGYANSTANASYRLLKERPVCEEIARVYKTVAEKLGIDEEFVLHGFKRLALESDPKVQVQAYNAIAKHLGMMAQKVDLNVQTQDDFVKNLYRKLTDE